MKLGSLERQVATQVKSRLESEQLDGGMKTEEMKPQISQRNADVFLQFPICAHLRHLWFKNFPGMETDNSLMGIQEGIGL